MSAAGGVQNAVANAVEIGANAFALFTKSQRQWSAKPLTAETIDAFKAACVTHQFLPTQILAHDSYLINLGNPDPEKLMKSRDAFIDEVRRCEQLNIRYLNLHPGSHLKKIGEDDCLALIAESIVMALDATESCMPVIENTAGGGADMGVCFEQLARGF